MTIVISSTDSYCDCWRPFFLLLEKFIDDISKYKIYLITDTLIYSDHSFVRTIKTSENSNIIPWADRIGAALNQIDDDSFLLLMDDYFLYNRINFNELKSLDFILKNNPEIGSIKIVSHHNTNFVDSRHKNLKVIKKLSSYRISLQPTLWKKDFLKKILIKGENPWHFEILGTFRSFFIDKKLLVVSDEWFTKNKKIYDTNGAGAIKKGEWIYSEFSKIESLIDEKIITSRSFNSEKKNVSNKLKIIKNTFQVKILLRSIKFIFSKK